MFQPSEIKNQSFKKGLFGYKASDVDTFVNTVYKAYEEVFNENSLLADELEKANEKIKENRLTIFDLENKISKAENVSSYGDPVDDKKAKKIVEEAQKQAAAIIAKAKEESDKILGAAKGKPAKEEPVKEAPKAEPKAEEKKSATSKFFKKAEEETSVASDDDEIFVGEIEDNRKPNKMMIGDGEEEGDGDFEFL